MEGRHGGSRHARQCEARAVRDPKPMDVARKLYLDLMERALLGLIYEDAPNDPWTGGTFNPTLRRSGRDWPSQAHTMIGELRMHNLRTLCEDLIARDVPGDFIE